MSSAQLELDLSPIQTPDYTPEMSIDERFDLFHANNPHVADALEVLAAEWLENHAHVGMKALYERLRWESGIKTNGEAYRLNNDFTPLYSRLLIARNPHWVGAIHVRERTAAA